MDEAIISFEAVKEIIFEEQEQERLTRRPRFHPILPMFQNLLL